MAKVFFKAFESAFESVTSSDYANKKRLADLMIKRSAEATGKPTPQAYQDAMGVLAQYQFDDDEKTALQAQTAIQEWKNKVVEITRDQNGLRKSVEQAKLDEKKAYYAAATGVKANFIASNDIAGLVAFTRATLNEELFKIQEDIALISAEDKDTASLENQLSDAYRRYKDIERLEDDILNGDGSSMREYGVFVDGDRNGIDGVFVAKANDLPSGVNRESYATLNETASVGGVQGTGMPVYAEFYIDPVDKRKKAVIGNREWNMPSGVSGNLSYNKKSDPTYVSNPKKGSFSLADFSVKNNPVGTADTYFTGITGFDEKGNVAKTLFRSPDGKQVFSIDEETRKQLEADPIEADKIKTAYKRNELDSRYVREVVIPNAQPYKIEPMQLQSVVPRASFIPAFFSPAPDFQTKTSTPSFFENKNVPNKPEAASGEQGFFNKARGFFRKINPFD